MVRTGATGGNTVNVMVSRFGHDPIAVAIAEGSTIGAVLDKAGLSLEGSQQLFCAGAEVRSSDVVDDGDVISIVTPKAAGTR